MKKPEEQKKPIPVRIAYIGGGSRNWAHFLMNDLLLHDGFTGEIRLYDIDPSMAELNARFGNWLQSYPKAASKWRYKAVNSLKAALQNADFVFASIQPGSIELMKIDLEEPEKYGIYQAVGDTVGPGGSIRSLRAIRDYRVIAEAVAEHAPDAWVLSFSNPMSVCTRTLFETFPGIKAFGCCHEVFGTQKMLANVYSKMTGEPTPPRQDIDVNVLGINHFTWIDRAAYKDTDLLKLLSEYIRQPGIMRAYSRQEIEEEKNVYVNHHQVTYELYRRFGVLPAAGDRHLAEFVPWFLTSEDSCFRWGFCLTPYSFRWQQYSQSPEKFRKMMTRREFPEPAWSGEEYLNQMIALSGQADLRTNVNLLNCGQMENIPAGAVVETNAIFSENRLSPVESGALPDSVNSLIMPHVINQESLIRAVFNGDKDLAFQAFLNEPLMKISIDNAWKLFNAMLEKTGFEFRS